MRSPPAKVTSLAMLADRIRSSLWFVPGTLITISAIAAVLTVKFDRDYDIGRSLPRWLFHGGSDAARATLSAIASSVMTVAGLAFSIIVVVLQLASSQFSPRVVRNFVRDRVIQFVLGMYMGTFTYALLVLRTVTTAREDGIAFVPATSVTVATALALTCMLLLVVFVHHVAQSVQVAAIIDSIASETRAAVAALTCNEEDGETQRSSTPGVLPARKPHTVFATRSGYLDFVDEAVLLDLPESSVLRLRVRVGDFVRHGDPLASLWTDADNHSCGEALRGAFTFERERTVRQDARFGFRMICDVALRALSPGTNDPTTACYCINLLGDLLCAIAGKSCPDERRIESDHGVVVFLRQESFAELLDLSFGQVLHYGKQDARVMQTVADALAAIAWRAEGGVNESAVRAMAGRVGAIVAHADWADVDRARSMATLHRALSP